MHLPNVQSTCALIRNLGRLHWRRDLISYWLLQTKMHPRLHVLPFNMYSAKPLVNIARKWAFPKQLPAKGMIGQGRQILAVHGNSCRYSRSFLPLMWKFQVDFPPSWYQNKSFVGDQPRSVVNAAELSIQFTFWKRMEDGIRMCCIAERENWPWPCTQKTNHQNERKREHWGPFLPRGRGVAL